jgi:hypothetical protein
MGVKSRDRKNGKLKIEIIKRINKQFDLEIPLDYPIVTHQTKFADSGGHKWYLKGDNRAFNVFGGCSTLTETLKHKGDFQIFREAGNIELIPN